MYSESVFNPGLELGNQIHEFRLVEDVVPQVVDVDDLLILDGGLLVELKRKVRVQHLVHAPHNAEEGTLKVAEAGLAELHRAEHHLHSAGLDAVLLDQLILVEVLVDLGVLAAQRGPRAYSFELGHLF